MAERAVVSPAFPRAKSQQTLTVAGSVTVQIAVVMHRCIVTHVTRQHVQRGLLDRALLPSASEPSCCPSHGVQARRHGGRIGLRDRFSRFAIEFSRCLLRMRLTLLLLLPGVNFC